MKKFLPKITSNQSGFTLVRSAGFTLVELLVVITIIAILSVIGITVFTGTQKGARDTQRRGDVEAISKAFEVNATTGTATPYAVPQATWFASGGIPKDPQGGEYFWNAAQSVPTAISATYVVCAKLENNNGNSSTAGASGGTFAAASGAAATHFCRKNLQ